MLAAGRSEALSPSFLMCLNTLVTFRDLAEVDIVDLQALLEYKQQFFPPVALQALSDLCPGRTDETVFSACELVGIPFASDDCTQNRHAGGPTDIADYICELHIHLGQRFLHVLYAFASRSHKALSLSQVGSQNPNLHRRTERIIQQPERVQLL